MLFQRAESKGAPIAGGPWEKIEEAWLLFQKLFPPIPAAPVAPVPLGFRQEPELPAGSKLLGALEIERSSAGAPWRPGYPKGGTPASERWDPLAVCRLCRLFAKRLFRFSPGAALPMLLFICVRRLV